MKCKGCAIGCLLISLVPWSSGLSPSASTLSRPADAIGPHFLNTWGIPRGGEQTDVGQSTNVNKAENQQIRHHNLPVPNMQAVVSLFSAFGKLYSKQLEQRPILSKSITAGLIFCFSDYLAQIIEKPNKSEDPLNYTRLVATSLVGLLYFGPAAHYWYEIIFQLLPGTSFWSTLQKAFWGQALFGPSFTCIFFATNLLQAGTFGLKSWWEKIRSDLPGAWLAGVGFWPLVDLISYSAIPVKWIPLFINVCSLIWTVYLSIIANRNVGKN